MVRRSKSYINKPDHRRLFTSMQCSCSVQCDQRTEKLEEICVLYKNNIGSEPASRSSELENKGSTCDEESSNTAVDARRSSQCHAIVICFLTSWRRHASSHSRTLGTSQSRAINMNAEYHSAEKKARREKVEGWGWKFKHSPEASFSRMNYLFSSRRVVAVW